MAKEKKVSAAKQKIILNYEKQKVLFASQGYVEQTEIISILKANLMVFVTALPLVVVGQILWLVVKGNLILRFDGFLPLLAAFLLCTGIHEVIHGIAWALATEKGWNSIYLGMMWESLTPYCHCKEPLAPKQYLLGGLAPGLLLGGGVYIAAFLTDSSFLIWLSILNTLAAGGDFTIMLSVFPYFRKKACILDHPTDCGFVAFVK